MQPKRVLRLACRQSTQTGAAGDRQHENGGPLNYTGPSNTSWAAESEHDNEH